MNKKTTYVFIDGQNLNLAIKNDIISKTGKVLYKGKKIDYKKLNMYLNDKYRADRQMIFLGYLNYNVKQVMQNQKLTRFAGRDAPLGLSGHRDDRSIVSNKAKKSTTERAENEKG
jgi:hypothetical protein